MHFTLEDLPPFPDEVPTVRIHHISHEKLLAGDDEEGKKVLESCQTDGFFYLDLTRSDEGQELLQESEDLLSLAKRAFAISDEEKRRYPNDKGGYKPAGTVKKTDKTLAPDTTEFFNECRLSHSLLPQKRVQRS
jgi:isopenicillin N synthase-like dioxygenase